MTARLEGYAAGRPVGDEYGAFLAGKRLIVPPAGIDVPRAQLHPALFDFQRDIVHWALHRGRAALFADCGMGKGPMALAWAEQIAAHTHGRVLVLSPLAVAQQFVREGQKFGIPLTLCRGGADVQPGINVTNYERLHLFDPDAFVGVVADESSILKAYDGTTRTRIIEAFARTPYRLACTATPAPNDHMELGNHAEFLGVMSRTEMLAMFFTHDGGETQKWRLKGHAEDEFWRWVCSWAVMIRKPSDLGYDDGAFVLPPLEMHSLTVDTDEAPEGMLFAVEAQTLTERRQARRASLADRVHECAALVNRSDEQWIVWADLNAEADALEKLIPGSIQVSGSDTAEFKVSAIADFIDGRTRVIVSKPSIFGWGLNLQNCRNIAFVGLSDSYEAFYQAIRRCWRFGQTRPVHCHVITSRAEGTVVANIRRKEQDAQRMTEGMVGHMQDTMRANLRANERLSAVYREDSVSGDGWTAHLGDAVEVVGRMGDGSVAYSVFSPPFASLYTYSNSERDMGNVRDHAEFYRHFGYLVGELYRVLMPGRLLSFHCMNLPTSKVRDGVIGTRDFRGELIRLFESVGFVFHSEVCIWKDPVVAMQRTKAIGLLYKQLKKDSAMSRQGIPDYLVTMRKPGVNAEPVTKDPDAFPVELWQRYASPVWMDINQTRTLQHEAAREDKDERHICPLQLDVIERAIRLWTNPGDLVLSPFMGIGSEGYIAIKEGRRFVGVELKESYHRLAVANLRQAEMEARTPDLFALSGIAV